MQATGDRESYAGRHAKMYRMGQKRNGGSSRTRSLRVTFYDNKHDCTFMFIPIKGFQSRVSSRGLCCQACNRSHKRHTFQDRLYHRTRSHKHTLQNTDHSNNVYICHMYDDYFIQKCKT